MPVITLVNGLRVANFSSPHCFKFSDGKELPACDEERAKLLMLDSQEEIVFSTTMINGDIVECIRLKYKMSSVIRIALKHAESTPGIDIIIVPLPVMEAIKQEKMRIGKFRTIRMYDRIHKTCYSNKFCV